MTNKYQIKLEMEINQEQYWLKLFLLENLENVVQCTTSLFLSRFLFEVIKCNFYLLKKMQISLEFWRPQSNTNSSNLTIHLSPLNNLIIINFDRRPQSNNSFHWNFEGHNLIYLFITFFNLIIVNLFISHSGVNPNESLKYNSEV